MARWFFGMILLVYLAGVFWFGLAAQIAGSESDVVGAMSHGAAWPWILMRLFEIV